MFSWKFSIITLLLFNIQGTVALEWLYPPNGLDHSAPFGPVHYQDEMIISWLPVTYIVQGSNGITLACELGAGEYIESNMTNLSTPFQWTFKLCIDQSSATCHFIFLEDGKFTDNSSTFEYLNTTAETAVTWSPTLSSTSSNTSTPSTTTIVPTTSAPSTTPSTPTLDSPLAMIISKETAFTATTAAPSAFTKSSVLSFTTPTSSTPEPTIFGQVRTVTTANHGGIIALSIAGVLVAFFLITCIFSWACMKSICKNIWSWVQAFDEAQKAERAEALALHRLSLPFTTSQTYENDM